jgi:hypothetical protein
MNLSLIIINYCNESCSYCLNFSNNINNKKILDLNKLYLLDNINFNNLNNIEIMGGEPGLVKKQDFDVLYNYLKNNKKVLDDQINISTNGLFLEKYHNYYLNFKYEYHIVNFEKFKIYNRNQIEYNIIFSNLSDIELAKNILDNFNIKVYIFFDYLKSSFSDLFFNKILNFFKEYKENIINNNYLSYIKNKKILNIYKYNQKNLDKKLKIKYIELC